MTARRKKTGSTVVLCALCGWMLACGTTSSDSGGANPATAARASTAETSRPGWIDRAGEDPRYPAFRFLTSVGSAPINGNVVAATDVATTNAKRGLSASMISSISSELELLNRETGVNGVYESVESYEERVLEATRGTLYGAERVDSFRDDRANAFYVLVVLDRDAQARGLLEDAKTRLARVTPADPSEAPGAQLRALLEEHVILESLVPPLIAAGAVIPRTDPLRPEFEALRGRVQTRVKAIALAMRSENIVVRAVSGGGQQGHAGESLAQPLVFEARVNGQPLVGFPVRFTLEHPDRAEIVEASRATDAQGRFSCRVNRLLITGDDENELVGQLDYDAFGPVEFRTPSSVLTYRLPTFATSRFAVWVSETNQGTPQPESAVAGSLRSALAQREGTLVELDNDLSPDELSRVATADLRWLQSKLSGKVDYLIRGSARSIYSGPSGPIHFSYAGGRIELIDIRSGARLVSFEQPPSSSTFKAGGGSESDSGVRALRAFAAGAGDRVIGEVDAVFRSQ